MRPARILVACFAIGLGACSLLTDFTSLTNGDDDGANDGARPIDDAGSDHPTSDAPATSDAPIDAPADAPVTNLYPSGTFEGDGGCEGNGGYQATIATETTVAHGGTKSCRVCMKPGIKDAYTIDVTLTGLVPAVGSTYRVEAWVRRAPSAKTPPSVAANIRTYDLVGANFDFVPIEEHQGTPISPPTETWTRVTADLPVTKPGPFLDWFVGADIAPDSTEGQCFLVDDVVVTVAPTN